MTLATWTLGAAVALALAGAPALAQKAPEKPKVVLGVGGKPALYYLPLTIAERKGFFKEEGLRSRSTISPAAPRRCSPSSAAPSTW